MRKSITGRRHPPALRPDRRSPQRVRQALRRLAWAPLLAIAVVSPAGAQERGVYEVKVRTADGDMVDLYRDSYALVIGVSDYTNGWPDLPGVKPDVAAIKGVLEEHGFEVTTEVDPDHQRLPRAITEFINRKDLGADDRLLIYFAGHGHTVKPRFGPKMGYIVPADAPKPGRDPQGFVATALPMNRIETFAQQIPTKHAIFLFDSCFSGALFALSRAVSEVISYKTTQPVRQFVTSGSEDDKVPDKSIFRSQLVAALEGEGDLNGDGYVTGTELGEFLLDRVVTYSRETQHPQYGTIRLQDLDKGDFVFQLPQALAPLRVPAPAVGIVQEVIDTGKTLLSKLDETRNTGTGFDYWPRGGIQIAYYHLATFASYETLSRLSPYPVFLSGPHGTRRLNLDARFTFGHYNPEFLRWFQDHLMEILEERTFVQATAELFRNYLGGTAMAYRDAYLVLSEHPKEMNVLLEDYKTRMNNRTLPAGYFYNLAWQEAADRFPSLKKLYATYDSNVAAPAVFFWLRRHIDGTHQQVFSILESVLGAYQMIDTKVLYRNPDDLPQLQ